jgi:hypothetical protein
MKIFAVFCVGAAVLASPRAVQAGSTPEDACVGLAEKAACTVLTPLFYEAYGTCQWTSTGTEAPQVTEAPNPAQTACTQREAGDACYFIDATSLLSVTGTCSVSTVVGFTGLTCEPDGHSEIPEEAACDNKAVDAPCVITKGDGGTVIGVCTASGGTVCSLQRIIDFFLLAHVDSGTGTASRLLAICH